MTFTTENSNKFPKTMFSKEILVEEVVTLGPMAHATLILYNKSKHNIFALVGKANKGIHITSQKQ